MEQHRWNGFGFLIALVLLCALAVGCEQRKACTDSTDCGGLRCVDGFCETQGFSCSKDNECDFGLYCNNGRTQPDEKPATGVFPAAFLAKDFFDEKTGLPKSYLETDFTCKVGCTNDDNCPQGKACYLGFCQEAVCGPRANPPTAIDATAPCYDGQQAELDAKGQCKQGVHSCEKNGTAWSPCLTQVLPAREECDGVDNDCNGKVDDLTGEISCACVVGSFRPCSTAPLSALVDREGTSISRCTSGVKYCVPDPQRSDGLGRWGSCLKEVTPTLNQDARLTCKMADADCNGLPDISTACECQKGDAPRPCFPYRTDVVEAFMKKNNVTSEDELTKKFPWFPCRKGVQLCEPRCRVALEKGEACQPHLVYYQWTDCRVGKIGDKEYNLRVPIPEEYDPLRKQAQDCNKIDDDCDGYVDNSSSAPKEDPGARIQKPCYPDFNTDFPRPEPLGDCRANVNCGVPGCPPGKPCVGICKRGTTTCQDDGSYSLCQGAVVPEGPKEVTCDDGKDNDCDGLKDSEDPDCKQP